MMHKNTSPQVVLPVGLLAIDSGEMAGRSHFVIISFSVILDRMGVTEIGVKSASC